jgi:hypothetical protein
MSRHLRTPAGPVRLEAHHEGSPLRLDGPGITSGVLVMRGDGEGLAWGVYTLNTDAPLYAFHVVPLTDDWLLDVATLQLRTPNAAPDVAPPS